MMNKTALTDRHKQCGSFCLFLTRTCVKLSNEVPARDVWKWSICCHTLISCSISHQLPLASLGACAGGQTTAPTHLLPSPFTCSPSPFSRSVWFLLCRHSGTSSSTCKLPEGEYIRMQMSGRQHMHSG